MSPSIIMKIPNRQIALYLVLLIVTGQSSIASARNSFSRDQSRPAKLLDHQSVPPKPGNSDWTADDLWVDAFDMDLCGLATFRPWQQQQSAFNCQTSTTAKPVPLLSSGARQAQPVLDGIFVSDIALQGEFPSYVQLNITSDDTSEFVCGATLIDDDLVLTTANCVDEVGTGIALTFGKSKSDSSGELIGQADKWCYMEKSGVDSVELAEYDLAIIKLAEPIKYKRNKIWPACMRLVSRHSNESICAIVGPDTPELNSSGEMSTNVLKTSAVVRADESYGPDSTYYMLNQRDKPQEIAIGSPVICYDNCREGDHFDRNQAFVVGPVSWTGPQGSRSTTYNVADLNLQEEYLLALIGAVRSEEGSQMDFIKCASQSQKLSRSKTR